MSGVDNYFMAYFLGVGTILLVLYGLVKWLVPAAWRVLQRWIWQAF